MRKKIRKTSSNVILLSQHGRDIDENSIVPKRQIVTERRRGRQREREKA